MDDEHRAGSVVPHFRLRHEAIEDPIATLREMARQFYERASNLSAAATEHEKDAAAAEKAARAAGERAAEHIAIALTYSEAAELLEAARQRRTGADT